MIELGVDELTLVLQLPLSVKAKMDPSDWPCMAEYMMKRFICKARFEGIFGEIRPECRPPMGYDIGFSFGEHNFFLAVAYHQIRIDMGVAIKFSAQALDYYTEKSGMKVYEFLKAVQDKAYTTRLSRVDLTADYIDEDIDVTDIYQSFIDNKAAVFREFRNKKTGEKSYRRCDLEYQGFLKGQEVPTIYLGSAQSNSRLRIYDKKREQIERNGTKLAKARACKNWVRFEGVFRHEFAHQIGENLLTVTNDNEYANLIANIMIQKFRIMVIDKGVIEDDTEYIKLLMSYISNQTFILKAPSSRNYDIAKSLTHLFFGSGAISTLYKIRSIWGEEAVKKILDFIYDYLKEYEPNDDCRYWLRKNTNDYRINYPAFDFFMQENISTRL